jgi:hypothetical protein
MLRGEKSVFSHFFLKKWGKIIHKCCVVRQDFIYLRLNKKIKKQSAH